MRSWVSALGLVVALGGCSPSNPLLLSPGAVSLSDEIEPFPVDYVLLVQEHLGIKRKRDLQISRPRSMVGDGVMDPQRWYVCVRQPIDPAEVVLVISGGKIDGTIRSPAPDLCNGGDYETLG
ncbi:MAG: hypothetical protein ACYC0C_11765 [Devosia sp.]